MRRRLALVLLLALSVTVSGCAVVLIAAGAAAGGAAVVWHAGWLRTTIPEPIERVHKAATATLQDLKVTVDRDEQEGITAIVEGLLPDGRRAIVKTKTLADKQTQTRIHVGFLGDQDLSLRILEQMKKRL